MGLISSGFGRYRSKEGGPITHKAVGGVEHGINRNPTASVVGTNPKLVKFLKDYSGGDWDDSDIDGMIKKPYKGK